MERTRNVTDFYEYWTTDAIRADLDTKRHNFSVLVTNKIRDFNLGSVIRSCNAFLGREVIIYGRKQFDRRSTVGTHLYENLKHIRYAEDLDFGDSLVVGIDNLPDAKPIETFQWPDKHVILAFGEETTGLAPEILAKCHELVYIKQYGSVRSLNVGCAASIAMFSYCLQRGNLSPTDVA